MEATKETSGPYCTAKGRWFPRQKKRDMRRGVSCMRQKLGRGVDPEQLRWPWVDTMICSVRRYPHIADR